MVFRYILLNKQLMGKFILHFQSLVPRIKNIVKNKPKQN